MKQYDVSQIIKSFMTNDTLDIRDEQLVVKLFSFCYENNIEPIYYSLENNKDYDLIQLIERVVSITHDKISPEQCISKEILNTILKESK